MLGWVPDLTETDGTARWIIIMRLRDGASRVTEVAIHLTASGVLHAAALHVVGSFTFVVRLSGMLMFPGDEYSHTSM